jgi:hypothetical protein
MGSDDTFDEYECRSSFLWKQGHSDILFADGGNILLGVSRCLSFIILFALDSYNRRLLRSKTSENTNVIPGLILPYYFGYIYLFIGFSLGAGLIDILLQVSGADDSLVNNWIIPIEQGLFHWLYEGLAFFLMRYGAGWLAMKRALLYSGIWGMVSFLFFFMLFSMFDANYGFKTDANNAYAVYISYQIILLVFYGSFVVLPVDKLFRRSAMNFYAKFNVAYYTVFILFGTLLYEQRFNAVCAGSIIIFILVSFLQPIAIFRTLQIDSQYWQGLSPNPSNPLSEVWDHVDVGTAQSMAESLETFNRRSDRLPIIHFGLLDFDSKDFIAGGFYRVYFGTMKEKRVAYKFLFAMELTPEDIESFYREASLLYGLRHDNVVICKGICVMPPSLIMILENCKYGSLYDFLYKPCKERETDIRYTHMSIASIGKRFLGKGGQMLPYPPLEDPLTSQSNQSITSSSTANPLMKTKLFDANRHAEKQIDISKMRLTSNHAGRVEDMDPELGMHAVTSSGVSNANAGVLPRMNSMRGSLANSLDSQENDSESGERKSTASSSRFSRIYESMASIASVLNRGSHSRGSRGTTGGGTNAGHSMTSSNGLAQYLSLTVRLRMMKDAVAGISFLHSKGFMHCDIKSLNFLVDEVILHSNLFILPYISLI